MMSSLPKQSIGLYLYEGQGWERAFIHAWRQHGHGKLIAVAHSTVRFWDLRYIDDPKIFDNRGGASIPLPDKIAVNGPAARKTLLDAGYPEKYLANVEALRYLHLIDSVALSQVEREGDLVEKTIKLLILGDIQAANNHPLFQLLGSLPKEMQDKLEITVKPHPSNYIDCDFYSEITYEVTTSPLKDIMGDFDVTFGANQTSANIDIYLFGLPIIIYRDLSLLNFSPLRGISGARFVNTSDELANSLRDAMQKRGHNNNNDTVFWMDKGLLKWKRLVSVINSVN